MFIETKEGQTHATCEDQLKKYGGKAKCCLCNVHDGCTLQKKCPWCKSLHNIATLAELCDKHQERWIKLRADESDDLERDMTKAIKHAGKYMKKEQDKVLRKKHGHRYRKLTNKCKCGKIRHSIACQMDGHKCYCDLTKPLYNL